MPGTVLMEPEVDKYHEAYTRAEEIHKKQVNVQVACQMRETAVERHRERGWECERGSRF